MSEAKIREEIARQRGRLAPGSYQYGRYECRRQGSSRVSFYGQENSIPATHLQLWEQVQAAGPGSRHT
jgi:hypothetical protein